MIQKSRNTRHTRRTGHNLCNFLQIEVETKNVVSAPRSKETIFWSLKNFKKTFLEKYENLKGFRGGGELFDHPVQHLSAASQKHKPRPKL